MHCSRKIFSIFICFTMMLYLVPPPASSTLLSISPQQSVPGYPLAQKNSAQLKCDQLAEAPDEPNNSGPGIRIDQINTTEAHSVCQQAADTQTWRARYQFIFARVLEAEQRWDDCAKWYQAAGDNGYAEAYVNLGLLYSRSQPPNYAQAANWYQKAVLYHSPRGTLMLAWLYQMGNGVQKNSSEAARLYADAGNRGVTEAMYRLAAMTREGDGVQKDPYVAAQWFYEAAKRGHPYAQEELGSMFAIGEGVKNRDDRAAFAWFLPAAQAGLPFSQTAVAIEYDTGQVVQRDPAQAVAWYRRAAAQDETYAMFKLGEHLRNGNGVAWSEAEAAQWFRKAADKGFPLAQSSLGYGYMHGLGLSAGQGVQDYRQAAYWLTLAAQQGEPYAQVNLGWLYESGQGVERNLQKAKSLYQSAARSSDPHVAEFAGKFAASMKDYPSDSPQSAQSSNDNSDWAAPVAIGLGLLALYAVSGSGHSSRSSASSGSSGANYPSDSFPADTNWPSSSSTETRTPVCRQVPVENAFSTQNGCSLTSPTACGNSGATTLVCD